MSIDPNLGAAAPGLVDRIKNILLKPKEEWARIDGEPADVNKLYMGYLLPIALVAVICMIIGYIMFPWSAMGITLRWTPMQAVISGVFQLATMFIGIFLMGIIVNALAPTFGSTQNPGKAHQVAVYSSTAAVLSGVFSIHPSLAILGLVGLYSLVLLWFGLPVLMKTPNDKKVGYFAVVLLACIAAAIVVSIVLGAIRTPLLGNVSGMPPI